MTATSILLLCLRLLGAKADFYIPNRIDEGYGLNHDALRTIAGQGGDVVVTVDCGITSVAEAETARELGLTLIITDHHQPRATISGRVSPRREFGSLGETAPSGGDCASGLPGSTYPFPGLCGAAVALKLAWALCQQASEAKRVGEAMRTFLMRAVGWRRLARWPMSCRWSMRIAFWCGTALIVCGIFRRLGLRRWKSVTGLDKNPHLACEDIGFTIGPRLNAAGRLGQAALAVELLTTDDPERAMKLAEFIHGLNEQRQTLERSVYRAAHKQAEEMGDPTRAPALVLAGRGWHPGVIGIVAGRLAEHYHRPTVLISLDELGREAGRWLRAQCGGFQFARGACSVRPASCCAWRARGGGWPHD